MDDNIRDDGAKDDGLKLSVVGICKLCGQTVVYNVDQVPDDPNEDAHLYCTCIEGINVRRLHRAHVSVETVCGEPAEQHGFTPLAEEQVEQIKGACARMIDGEMQSVAFKITGQDEVRLKVREKDGWVLVRRVRKVEIELA